MFDGQNLRVVTLYHLPVMMMAKLMMMIMTLTLKIRLLTLMMVLKSNMNVKTSGMMTVSDRPFEFTANISSLSFYCLGKGAKKSQEK